VNYLCHFIRQRNSTLASVKLLCEEAEDLGRSAFCLALRIDLKLLVRLISDNKLLNI
jgi:hypothetical protein